MLYPRVSLYALMLAAAGIPLYIHLPRFASVELGIGLGAIGTILLALRLIDLVQDPLIGWAIDRWPGAQAGFACAAAAGLGIGFPLLFMTEAGQGAAPRLVAVLILLFSAYSLGNHFARFVADQALGTDINLQNRECRGFGLSRMIKHRCRAWHRYDRMP